MILMLVYKVSINKKSKFPACSVMAASRSAARSKVSTASSQVEMRQRPVSWRFPRSEYGETLSFYDDYHAELILINSECVYKSHRRSSKLNRFNMVIPNHTAILSAKFSPQNKYIGLQINVHEVVGALALSLSLCPILTAPLCE